MSILLNDAVIEAKNKKFYVLEEFLQSNLDKFQNKQIENIFVADDNEPLSYDKNCLYFKLGQCSDYKIDGNIVYFEKKERMYTLAYYFSILINECEKSWYNKIIETNLKFNNITLKSPDVMKMIICFNEIMKNPVIIYDEFWNITVITDEYLDQYDRHENTIEKLYIQNVHYYKQKVTFLKEDAPVKDCNRLLFPVLSDDKMPKGYLAIFDVETAYEDMDMMILEIFANAVLVEMRRLLNIQSIEAKFISDFIYDIIYRKNDKAEEINRKASLLNIVKDADYCMIAFNPLGKVLNPRIDTNGYISQHEFMYDRVMNNIKNFHTKYFEQDIVSKFDNATYILHKVTLDKAADKKDEFENIKHHCHKINKMLSEFFDGMVFQIGIGDIVHGLGDVSSSFRQAWAAISYGEILHKNDESFIISYPDNSLLKLFGRLKETDSLEEIIPSSLIKLCQYDEKNNAQLYQTLKMYLDCNCNAKKTAEKLYIHYKTILYRLDKIRNSFDIDIENSNSRLYIELGIQLLDLKRNSR